MGEPTGGRRLTDGENIVEEPERPVQPGAHPPPSGERGEDGTPDERTSPTPYAEDFTEWVADEATVSPDNSPRREDGAETDAGEPAADTDSRSNAEQAKDNEDRALKEGLESPG